MKHLVSQQVFRDAMASFAAGVTVVTARSGADVVGLTATAFSSVSLSPPLVLVCIGHTSSAHADLAGADVFGISVLHDRQRWIAEQCARSGPDRFRDVELGDDVAPIVQGALAGLVCKHHAAHEAGDHTILIGEVVGVDLGHGNPLVYFGRRFGGFDGGSTARSFEGVSAAHLATATHGRNP